MRSFAFFLRGYSAIFFRKFRPKFPDAHLKLHESLRQYEVFLRYLFDKPASETYKMICTINIKGVDNVHALCPFDESFTYLC